jgi:hypothetical protein
MGTSDMWSMGIKVIYSFTPGLQTLLDRLMEVARE